MAKIGLIGGSGLYDIEGLTGVKSVKVSTPFGEPSDRFVVGKLDGIEVAFLPRHGKGHTILPSELNYRANIYAMKKLGVERIISVAAVGSLKKELKPLDIVITNQFVDRTNQARKMTFFGEGIAAHIGFAQPVCPVLSELLYKAGKELGATIHNGGSYLNMEGPAFSTIAESNLYRSWGMDVIGMTNMAEAKLAREAEICYSTMAMITDYDCWHLEEGIESVSVDLILQNLRKNAEMAKNILKKTIPRISERRDCPCAQALKNTIITRSDAIPQETKKKLDLIIGKYI